MFSLLLYQILAANLYSHHDELLLESQKALIPTLVPFVSTEFRNFPISSIPEKELVGIRDRDGRTVLATAAFQKISQKIDVLSVKTTNGFLSTETHSGEPIRFLITPLQGGRYLVVHGSLLGDINHTLEKLKFTLILLIPLVLSATSFGGYIIASRAIKPVTEIARQTREIRARNLDRLIDVKTSDVELDNLVITLNEMLGRLNSSFRNIEQFTADASHELKTPLTIVAGTLEVALGRERTVAEYKEAITTVVSEINRLSAIVSELLLLSSFDTHNREIKRERLNLGPVVESSYELMQPLFSDKAIQSSLSISSNPQMTGDACQLSQVFINLLENAIKYTPSRGSVDLALSKVDSYAVVSVKDSGSGIPKQHRPHIFERFYQIDKLNEDNRQGTGLGLAIVKRIVEAHGGQISVTDGTDGGSTFTVRLPINDS